MSGDAGDGAHGRQGMAARMADRLEERRERHRRRSRPLRAAIVVAGFVVVVTGIGLAAPGVPGPGLLVAAVGLAILALEFDWADRLLQRALAYVDSAAERATEVSPRRRAVVALLFAAAVAAAIAAVIVFDVPIPPW